MKTGTQAGKIRPATIGIIDLHDYEDEAQETILQGIKKYFEFCETEKSPLPPVMIRFDFTEMYERVLKILTEPKFQS